MMINQSSKHTKNEKQPFTNIIQLIFHLISRARQSTILKGKF